uniref:DUF223 domain-containing protein n=1 Tax=Leersia perrieri TaxID=77586 RepID=A0A0D9X725_9ORYZ
MRFGCRCVHWLGRLISLAELTYGYPTTKYCCPTRSMAPTTLSRKRTSASPSQGLPRFKTFDDLEYDNIYGVWSVVVKVDVKFNADARGETQRFILMDISGSKIEAIAWEPNVQRFDALHSEGQCYTIHRVRFQPNLEEAFHFRSIGHPFECILRKDTTVENFSFPIQFPPFPTHLMPFHDVYRRPNMTFVDIAGVVVHRGELEHIGKVPYREFTLMDTRCNLLVVGVWAAQLNKHALNWSLAYADNAIVLGTMLKNNKIHGNIESSDHTVFNFNPIHPETLALQNLRHRVATGAMDLRFVRRYIENRWAYLATITKESVTNVTSSKPTIT